MVVGFSAYVVLLGFERALMSEPLVASSAAQEPAERATSVSLGLTLTIAASLPTASVFAAIGVVLPTEFGRGMLLFAPWLVPAIAQDLGRSILFGDGRGRSAALADVTWLLTMAATSPVAFVTGADWAVASCWGVGAVAGAAVALRQIRWRPAPLHAAFVWWKTEAWPYGRWVVMGATLYNVAFFSAVLALVSILGAEDFGGLRAVESVFAPLTLLLPALSLPGLPLVSRIANASPRRALAVAVGLGAVTTVVTFFYVVIFSSFPDLLAVFFGDEFRDFSSIIVPVGVGQVLAAPAFGVMLYLRAERRGRTIFWLVTLNAFLFLACSVTLASLFGLTGAAWSGAATAALGGIALIAVVRRAMMSHSE